MRNRIFFSLLLFGFIFCISFSIAANPIPVYPNPDAVVFSTPQRPFVSIEWIIFVYIANFFLDILIVYMGLFIIDRSNLLENQNVLDFSKKTFFLAIAIISIVGMLTELLLGSFLGGLILALIIIFFSFVFVSKYLLLLCWNNSYRMGLFAIIINILIWVFIFSL
jgi:hypothetical protein